MLALDEASLEVDALVADNSTEDFGYHRNFAGFDRLSRSSTPSVPPGFGLPIPFVQPMPIHNEYVAVPKTTSKIVPTSAPFTPSRNLITRAVTSLTNVSVPTSPIQSIAKPKVSEAPKSQAQAKEDVKTLATNSGLSKAIASQSTASALQLEDFPALDSGKKKTVATPAAVKPATPGKHVPVQAANKKLITASSSTPNIQSASKENEKSKIAEILSTSIPSKSSSKPAGAPDTQAQPTVVPSAFPPLPSSTPAAVQSPLARTVAKTLRLVPTPKTEIPPTGSVTPSSTTSMFPPPNFVPSRHTSITSNTRLDRPPTPTSEIISDNASITSASLSRASSPPPTKIGSAPVRVTTKSMQKKQRREIQKEKEKLELGAVPKPKPEPEPEIAPIMGRKKKQKKERAVHSAAGGSTPAVSRPATPGPAEPASEEISHEIAEQPIEASIPLAPAEKEVLKPGSKSSDAKGKGKAKAIRSPTPESVPTLTEQEEEEPTGKPLPTPAAIWQELISGGTLGDANSLNFLKPPSTTTFKITDPPVDMQNANPKLAITAEDGAALLAGRPVHKIVDGGSRIMLTPNGDCVRNLTPEEEQRYLELQARIAKQAGPAAFSSAKHHANSGFTLIGGRAVPNGPPPFFPVLSTGAVPMDPVSKIQRDEALSYINQFVLPSLSSNSQLEKALNANALDAEMLRSGEVPAWATWGSSRSAGHPEDGDGAYGTQHEGILATGLEHMTAHFAIGKDIDRGQPMGNVSLLSLSEAESAMQTARKETENLEKRLNAILKKNRRILLGTGH